MKLALLVSLYCLSLRHPAVTLLVFCDVFMMYLVLEHNHWLSRYLATTAALHAAAAAAQIDKPIETATFVAHCLVNNAAKKTGVM